jgi:hypothetical protein
LRLHNTRIGIDWERNINAGTPAAALTRCNARHGFKAHVSPYRRLLLFHRLGRFCILFYGKSPLWPVTGRTTFIHFEGLGAYSDDETILSSRQFRMVEPIVKDSRNHGSLDFIWNLNSSRAANVGNRHWHPLLSLLFHGPLFARNLSLKVQPLAATSSYLCSGKAVKEFLGQDLTLRRGLSLSRRRRNIG